MERSFTVLTALCVASAVLSAQETNPEPMRAAEVKAKSQGRKRISTAEAEELGDVATRHIRSVGIPVGAGIELAQ